MIFGREEDKISEAIISKNLNIFLEVWRLKVTVH